VLAKNGQNNHKYPPTPLGVPVQALVKRSLLLDNMIFAKELQDETTRNEFKEEVRNECARCGIIKDIAVPMPPPDADINDTPGRIYVHFQDEFSAHMAKEMLQGRVFDGNTVFVSLISDIEYEKAASGEWLPMRPPSGNPSLMGVLRVRGMPPKASKGDLVNFFYGRD